MNFPAVAGIILPVFLSVLPMPAQQGMGSTSKAIPRASPKVSSSIHPPEIHLQDVSKAFGITAPNFYGGERTKRHILEMTGNGVALFDYNNDGKLDVLLVNGARLDGTSRPSVLYRNLGQGKFADATREATLATAGWSQGVCAGDFDNDGFTDLLITRYGNNLLLHNESGKFRELPFPATPAQFNTGLFNTGCTFFDYDRDGRLDLFVSNYVAFPPSQLTASAALCDWLGLKVFCGPRGFASGVNRLYHNEGNGKFRDVSMAAGIVVPGVHYGLAVTSADFDDDGWPDIYVACDSTPSLLFRNNHDGTFAEVAVPSGVAYGDNGEEQGGMGVAIADYDNDGRIDILRTNFIDETTATLYRNMVERNRVERMGELFFSNRTVEAGLAVHTRFVAWGTQFLDLDQDGYKDIIIANGHIYPELSRGGTTDSFEMPRLLYWNLGNGSFADITKTSGAALSTPRSSRGLAVGDLDGDGSPEIIIVNMNAAPTVLKNNSAKGNGILVKLTGVQSNRSAIGAKIVVAAGTLKQTSVIASGSSYLSQSDFRQHFGLGKAERADRIEVLWPSGGRESVLNVRAGREIQITEGKGVTAQAPFTH